MGRRSKRYTYILKWCTEDERFIATCKEFPSISAYGSTTRSALKEISEMVDEAERGLKLDERSSELSGKRELSP